MGGTPLRDHFLTSKVAGGRPRRLRDDFATIFYGFGSPFGVPGWALWGSFWRMFFETDLFKVFFSDIFVDSEKGVKMELPKGGWTCNLTTPVHVS